MSLVRFRPSVCLGFPGTCLNIRIPCCYLSHRQESMGLPKFPEYLFLHAMACGLRRIYPSSPITDGVVLPSEPVKSSASATSLFRSCTSTSGSADSPTACKILCLRFTCIVRQPTTLTPPQAQDSIRSGWLILLRQGLSPCKIRRTLLGAKRCKPDLPPGLLGRSGRGVSYTFRFIFL